MIKTSWETCIKFQPKHEWKLVDILKRVISGNVELEYIKEINNGVAIGFLE